MPLSLDRVRVSHSDKSLGTYSSCCFTVVIACVRSLGFVAILTLVQLAFQCAAHRLALEGRRLGVSYAFRKPGKTDILALLYPTVAMFVASYWSVT